MLWRFERGAGHLAGLSLAVGEAVARALVRCGVERVQVKWPNDVVVDLRKIAGILVETSGESQGPSVAVIGVGVNYRLSEKTLDLIDQAVTDVAQCAPHLPTRSQLLGELLAALAVTLAQFDAQGFPASRDAWRALHAYHGRRVRVFPSHEAAYDAEVDRRGHRWRLVVSTADGRTHNLASADISLRTR